MSPVYHSGNEPGFAAYYRNLGEDCVGAVGPSLPRVGESLQANASEDPVYQSIIDDSNEDNASHRRGEEYHEMEVDKEKPLDESRGNDYISFAEEARDMSFPYAGPFETSLEFDLANHARALESSKQARAEEWKRNARRDRQKRKNNQLREELRARTAFLEEKINELEFEFRKMYLPVCDVKEPSFPGALDPDETMAKDEEGKEEEAAPRPKPVEAEAEPVVRGEEQASDEMDGGSEMRPKTVLRSERKKKQKKRRHRRRKHKKYDSDEEDESDCEWSCQSNCNLNFESGSHKLIFKLAPDSFCTLL